jgi:hypothetical protein
MPWEGGPIARMLFEHEVTKQLAANTEQSARGYLQSGKAEEINRDLAQSEETKLKELGKTRSSYEKRVSDVESGLT